jgi:hypothetical protein
MSVLHRKTKTTCFMKRLPNILLAVALTTLLATSSGSFAQEAEKKVAFQTAEKKYVTTGASGSLDLSGTKIGSKQTFTLIDVNGGDLADGDEIKVRYNPGNSAGGTPSKPNYWQESKDGGLKRGGEAGVFKVNKVEGKYAIQTPGGKFVAAPTGEGALTVADKQDGALLLEIVDATSSATPKKTEKTEKPADK